MGSHSQVGCADRLGRWSLIVSSIVMLTSLACNRGGATVSEDTDPVPDTETGSGETDTDETDPRTEHCPYAPAMSTARAGGVVAPGPVRAAALEEPIDLPIGSTLGAYGNRSAILGAGVAVDKRTVELAGSFIPSVGVETFPMARVVALEAGDEQVVLVKLDLGVGFESLTWDVAERLGPAFGGKVMVTYSHSHGAYGHYTEDVAMQIAFGRYRQAMYGRLRDQVVRLATQALSELQPAHIGIAHDGAFDPDDRVTRDRREQNDHLLGGKRKDHDLFVIRIDAQDGSPLALLPIFGIHGTVLGARNLLVTQDATGAIERALEETFDERVVVMHLQGAAGDVSPVGGPGIDCSDHDRCYDFARVESIGHLARDAILAAWTRAGEHMQSEVEMEMLSRSIPLGPDSRTFVVRGGELQYGPWDGVTPPDRVIYTEDGRVASPVDEFNAPSGAALCSSDPLPLSYPRLPGVEDLPPYDSCMLVDESVTKLFSDLFAIEQQETPVCHATRTTISALRIGEYVIAGLPGEVVTLFADTLRSASPVPYDKTIVLGYVDDNIGYLLTPEDWLAGGYEPSINLWGPLEGQAILERTADLLALAVTPEREDATQRGDVYVVASEGPEWGEPLPPPDPAPDAGMVPDELPETLFVRPKQLGLVPQSAQPPQIVSRLDSVFFVWIGEDPMSGTPRVTLEHQPGCGGIFTPVQRRSGRQVRDLDMILTWTPDPLVRVGTDPRTHYWAVEWQAVTPFGMRLENASGDELDARVGLPTGCYRFHVEGSDYSLHSQAFEVEPAQLEIESSTDGADLVLSARIHAPHGFRLLDPNAWSNRPLPLHAGTTATVVITPEGRAPLPPGEHTVGPGGEIRLVGGVQAPATITVFDRFGNAGSIVLATEG